MRMRDWSSDVCSSDLPLWPHLADDERQVGDEVHDDADRDAVAVRRQHGEAVEPVAEAVRQRRAAEGAGEDADQGDADLNRRQDAAGLVHQAQGRSGPAAALCGPLAQPAAPRTHPGTPPPHPHAVNSERPKESKTLTNTPGKNE